ncbi:hypothetical protein [Streptomyces sp. NRRL S-340]|uniref:hypothetical protein n=1 Tax=Streptomyces sp. NRRL S-340 TaxID=1463901 RepID=UPI001F1F0EAB|nr:hypothetical protein [Streptomyces sp. NRRL S-340]
MSGLPEREQTGVRGGYLRIVGPYADPVRVLGFYERDGHSDASAAWESFTSVWNWSAPLPAAVPWDPSGAAPLVRGVAGGFSVSGQWRLPPAGAGAGAQEAAGGRWLALRLTEHPRRAGAAGEAFGVADPDVVVVASKVLPRPADGARAAGDTRGPGCGTVFRLADAYVPGGFATSSAGTPLGAGDAVFVWAAVAGLAFGAARRLTDALARLDAPGAMMSPAGAAAELAAALHDERLSLAARLHGVARAAAGDRPAARAVLAGQVRRAARLVHQVVSAAYEYGLAFRRSAAEDPLISLVDDSTPILQYMRYAVDLLPPDERTPTVEGDTR